MCFNLIQREKDMRNDILVTHNINALSLFTEDGLDQILLEVEDQVRSFVPDTSSVKSRKDIASLARKIASTKVFLDSAGKQLVKEWKENSKLVDESRKKSRDFLDNLKEEIRLPLTEWELDEEERVLTEKRRVELEAAMQEADIEDKQKNKESEIKKREEELAAKEEEFKRQKKEEQDSKDRLEKQGEIIKKAREDAEEKAKEAVIKANKEKEKAVMQAKKQIEGEKVRMEDEKQRAIKQAQEDMKEAAQKAQDARIDAERKCQIEEDMRIADQEHRKTVKRKVLTEFMGNDIPENVARLIINLIDSGKIPSITINY